MRPPLVLAASDASTQTSPVSIIGFVLAVGAVIAVVFLARRGRR